MTLTLDEQMINELVNILGECPARVTRGILNKIEATIIEQNKEEAKKEGTDKE